MKQTFLTACLQGNNTLHASRLHYFLIAAGLCILCGNYTIAQQLFENTAPSKFRIVFTDKSNSPYQINIPSEFLSQKSIERRTRHGIPITEKDLPVNPAYLDSIIACGARVIHMSKWFNAATVEIHHDSVFEKIARLSFVRKGNFPAPVLVNKKETQGTMAADHTMSYNYGPSLWQTAMLNGNSLHEMGYTGNNVVMAIIDAGFYNADNLLAFQHLWENGQILGTRDFVKPGNDVFREANHGMAVLSLIAGSLPGQLTGTAPDASFWLLRSENTFSEYIIEEDSWIAAAEFADSAGVDIISTSLGYNNFDDPAQDHSYQDMDGSSTRISIAADIAASNGILVVVSAGNEGQKPWHYISAPADADSVLAVGAVDYSGTISDFSSRGPSSDQDVKPDIVAMGENDYVAGISGGVVTGNGTSYAAPIIAGLSACLLQGNPDIKPADLAGYIRRSADRYFNPDDSYGYGIPDFSLAHLTIQWEKNPVKQPFQAFPNPFKDYFYIYLDTPVEEALEVHMFDMTGKEVLRNWYPNGKYISIKDPMNTLNSGVYLLHIQSGDFSYNLKMVKL